MNARGRHDSKRTGFTVIEVSLALTVLLAASILLAQFLVASHQQRRGADQRRIALEEISNRMERALATKYEAVTKEALEKESLSPLAREQLPAARMMAEVEAETGPPEGMRIRLEISWEQGGDRVGPLGLTAWRFPAPEGSP